MLNPIASYIHPEEESLGRYGMSCEPEYRGLPNISIPIYTVEEGTLELPISVYYDASGIKVDQASTCIGLGWNMNCGGSINHTIIGTDDFNTVNTLTYEYGKCKEFLNQYLPGYTTNSWPMYYNIQGVGRSYYGTEEFNNQRNLISKMSRGFYNPDMFHANFNGHSLSFVIDTEDKHVIVLNDNATKYKIEYVKSSNWPEEITITDDRGIKYIFRSFAEYFGRKDSYYLTEMSSVGGADHIYIEYDSFKRQLSENISQTMLEINDLTGDNQLHDALWQMLTKSGDIDFSIPSNSTIFTKYYPKRIRTSKETIEFSVENAPEGNGSKAISRISVTSSNGNVKTHDIIFHHGEFKENKDNTGVATSKFYPDESYGARLKLLGIDIDEKKYSFEYNENNPLPSIFSMSRDYWGYYNGKINRNLVGTPRFSGTQPIEFMGDANRFASVEYSKAGVLTKITYPTGGYTVYDYELNHFHDRYYYYPSAERIPQIPKSIHNIYVNAATTPQGAYNNGVNNSSDTFSLDKDTEVDVTINVFSSDPSKYNAAAHLYKYKDGGLVNVRYLHTSVSKPGSSLNETIKLTAGHYVMTVTVPYVQSDYATNAHVNINYPITDNITYDQSIRDDSGESVGGGLRIKSIKHYDGEEDKFVGGSTYNYYGGKLLIPTQDIEYQDIKFAISDNCNWPIKSCKLKTACSEMKHQPFEFYGMPYIGYSKVIKTDITSDNRLGAQTVYRFTNEAYNTNQGAKCYYNNSFNGKMTEKTILSSEQDTIYHSVYKYSYSYNNSEVVKYHKTMPRFVDISDIEIASSGCVKISDFDGALLSTMILRDILLNEMTGYDLSTYPLRNRWHYLTDIAEKQYVGGKPILSTMTAYDYNSENYKEASVTVVDGLSTKRTKYWYPSDYKTEGCSDLYRSHCLSTLTMKENYKQGKLVGGEMCDYSLKNGIPTIKKISKIGVDSIAHMDFEVTKTDVCGNVLEYVDKGGNVTSLLWSYNNKYPIMEISGVSYDKVSSCSSLIPFMGSKVSVDKEQLLFLHDIISKSTGGEVRAFVYNPWYKVSCSIEPNGNVTNYQYDNYGRLIGVNDSNDLIMKKYEYNYRK